MHYGWNHWITSQRLAGIARVGDELMSRTGALRVAAVSRCRAVCQAETLVPFEAEADLGQVRQSRFLFTKNKNEI